MCGRTETVERRRMVRALAGAAAGPDSPVRGRLPAGAGRPGLAVLGPKPDGAGTVRPPLPGDLVWLQALGERPRVRGRWPEIVLGLAGGAALLTLALFLLLFVFFLRDYDRVSEWEGQTVVAEYRGIDRGSHQCPRVCRYESWLLRGEELGPGR